MQDEKTPLQQLIRGLIILSVSTLISIITYYFTNAWIFDINIFDYEANWQNFVIVMQNLGSPYLKLKAYYPIAYALTPFFCCIVYWLLSTEKITNSYGNARFATEKDYEAMGFNLEGKGVQLACLVKGKKRIPISTQKPLAILIVAPAGTGKTASVALPNLFALPNSCFVLDIKGELLQKSAGYRQKNFNNEILVFSPLSKDSNTMFFNPFDNKIVKDMEFVEMMQLADQVAGTIFVGEKGKENDHWIVSAKTLFTFFALYNMQKYRHTNLGELSQAPKKDYFDELQDEWKKQAMIEDDSEEIDRMKEFYGDDDEKKLKKNPEADMWKLWLQQTAEDKSLDDITRNQARAYLVVAENEFASVKSTYDTFMKVFANPRVAKATSKMSFDYEDLREKKITCYVVIQSEDMDILAPLVRILVESFFKKLMKNENSDPNKFIYFILDEFIRFGKMSYLLEAPALCRSYGLIPLYITQSYEQIKKYYGDDDLKILRANAAFQVVFRMNSFDDAKTLSDMVGDYTRKKLSTSKDSMAILKKNNSISEEGYKLITPQDILSAPDGQVYLLAGGYLNRPIKTQANLWFKNKALNGADKTPYDLENRHLQRNETQADENESNETTSNSEKKDIVENTQKTMQEHQETINKSKESVVVKNTESSNSYSPFRYKKFSSD